MVNSFFSKKSFFKSVFNNNKIDKYLLLTIRTFFIMFSWKKKKTKTETEDEVPDYEINNSLLTNEKEIPPAYDTIDQKLMDEKKEISLSIKDKLRQKSIDAQNSIDTQKRIIIQKSLEYFKQNYLPKLEDIEKVADTGKTTYHLLKVSEVPNGRMTGMTKKRYHFKNNTQWFEYLPLANNLPIGSTCGMRNIQITQSKNKPYTVPYQTLKDTIIDYMCDMELEPVVTEKEIYIDWA